MHDDERAFLAGILENPLDNAIRLIYADWLDEHDRSTQADYLRVECQMSQFEPADIRYKLKRAHLVMIGKSIDPEWIATISRVAINNCPSMQNTNSNCPRKWEMLKATESPMIKECEICRRSVYFCTSILSVDNLQRQQEIIVVDPRLQYGTTEKGNTHRDRLKKRKYE